MRISLLSVLTIVAPMLIATGAAADDIQSPTPTKPIPQVNTGLIEMQEIKPTAALDVKAGSSRAFRTKTKIIRISVSDPTIAEPVVVSENQFIILGKGVGNVSLFVWCEGDSPASKKPM
jgi:Flp pilus assembly secretin CpaC